MVQLREVCDEIRKIGGQMYAVSVDTPEQSHAVVEKHKLPFEILCDTGRNVIHAYDLSHPGGGPHGSEVAVPAHVLIDRGGKIAWRHRAKRIQDRPDPQEDLAQIARLKK